MFLCDDCHDPRQHIDIYRSLGACEGCGKRRACIDCHQQRCDPPKITATQEALVREGLDREDKPAFPGGRKRR